MSYLCFVHRSLCFVNIVITDQLPNLCREYFRLLDIPSYIEYLIEHI